MTRLYEVSPGALGVDESERTPAYEERRGDAELEWRLGATGPLVVVAGPRRAGTSRAAARAARALLGDHVVVGHEDGVAPVLPDLVERAARAMRRGEAPGAVVWLDGAGLAALDAITPALVAALPAGVRIVVTVEELLLCTWFPDPGTLGVLAAPGTLVRLGPRDHGGPPCPVAVSEALTPSGSHSPRTIALARAAADWRRAGVPRALDREHLLHLARGYRTLLGLDDTDAEDRASTALLDRIDAGDTLGVRLLRRQGSGRDAHYTTVPGADVIAAGISGAAWPPPPALADHLAAILDDHERDVVARTLLLRGAADLVVRLVDDGWGHPNPTQAGELADAATRAGYPALTWHRTALWSTVEAHVLAARRALAVAAVVPLRIVRPAPTWSEPVVNPPLREEPDTAPAPVEAPVEAPPPPPEEELEEEPEEERPWDRATFETAEAAVRWTVVGRDLEGAWEWLAILESTDPPVEFAELVAARRRQVEDLARRRREHATEPVEPEGFAAVVDGLRRARGEAPSVDDSVDHGSRRLTRADTNPMV